MTTPAAPTGMIMTARAAPNCTEIPAEITSATGPRPRRRSCAGGEADAEADAEAGAAPDVASRPPVAAAGAGDEEGAGISPD